MTWKQLETHLGGHLEGSALPAITLRGNAETDELDVVEVGDISIAPRAIPADAVHRTLPARDFHPSPVRTVDIGGQVFTYQWAARFGGCSGCNREIEHFAFLGPDRDMVRQVGQESARLLGYCETCANERTGNRQPLAQTAEHRPARRQRVRGAGRRRGPPLRQSRHYLAGETGRLLQRGSLLRRPCALRRSAAAQSSSRWKPPRTR